MRRILPLCLSLIASSAAAQTRTLTLGEAITIAARNNPQFQQTLNNRTNTGLNIRTAYAALFPTLGSSLGLSWREGRQTYIEGQPFGAAADVLSSNYSISLGAQYSYRSLIEPRVAAAGLDAADATVEVQRASLQLQVTTQYFDVLQAARSAELQDSLVKSSELQLALAQARERSGSGTPLETKSSEVQLGQARIAALRAHNSVQVTQLQMFETLGIPPTAGVQLTTDLPVAAVSFRADELIAQATQNNPTLAAGRANQRASELRKRQALSSYIPSLSLSTGLGGQTSMLTDAKGDARTWPFDFSRNPLSFSVGLSLPIWDGYRREQQSQSAQIALNSAQQDVRRSELQLTTTITSRLLALSLDYETVQLQTVNAATAREALALAQERYRVGSTSYLDLARALDAYQNAENARLLAIYTYHKDFAALEAAVGRPLR